MRLCLQIFIKIIVIEIFAIGQSGIFYNQMDDIKTIHLVNPILHSRLALLGTLPALVYGWENKGRCLLRH